MCTSTVVQVYPLCCRVQHLPPRVFADSAIQSCPVSHFRSPQSVYIHKWVCSLSLTSQEKQNLRDRNAEVSRIKLQSFKCTAVMAVLCIQRQTKPLIISEAVFSHILSLVATLVYFSCVQISNRLRSKQLPFETVRNH